MLVLSARLLQSAVCSSCTAAGLLAFFMSGQAMPVWGWVRGSLRRAFSPGWLKGQVVQSWQYLLEQGNTCSSKKHTTAAHAQILRSACCWLPLWKPRVLRGSRSKQGQGAAAEAASTRLKLCALSAEQLTFMQYILKSSLRYNGGSGASRLPPAACSLTAVASFCAFCSRHTVVCKGLA